MNDAEIVSAIAGGQLDGLDAALERYAGSLFDYCHRKAPAVAAEAVSDAFIIGWERLPALSDPGRLHEWLREVAENGCLRRSLTNGVGAPGFVPSPLDTPPDRMPPGLPSQVLAACADSTPAGRAYRVSAVYQAGPFGHDGFPKSGGRLARWRRTRLTYGHR